MIDIHSHILPEVDDGAESVEQALEMLRKAYESGTDAIVLTPHYAPFEGGINSKSKIEFLFGQFKKIVSGSEIPVKLFPGVEYNMLSPSYFMNDVSNLKTINGSRYLLTEFPFNIPEKIMIKNVEFIIKQGFVPVIAHPERYEAVKTYPEFLDEVIRKGAFLQLNKGSLSGDYGEYAQKAAMHLLKRRRYSFIGSDAHGIQYRGPVISDAYGFVSEVCGKRYAAALFMDNPATLIENKSIR